MCSSRDFRDWNTEDMTPLVRFFLSLLPLTFLSFSSVSWTSLGVAVDGDGDDTIVVRRSGKVQALLDQIETSSSRFLFSLPSLLEIRLKLVDVRL